jgi:hypothetical protein
MHLMAYYAETGRVCLTWQITTVMYPHHPNSSHGTSPGKKQPLYSTHSIIYNKCFHQRKGKEEKHQQQQQHQNAVIVATGIVHFVSHEMNECYQMLTLFWRVHLSRFTISSSCHSLLVFVSTY